MQRLPTSISASFLIACAANFGVVMLMKTSAPVAFSLTMWLSIVARRFRSFPRLLSSTTLRRGRPSGLQVVFAEIIVLIKDRDLAVGFSLIRYFA